LSFGIFFLFWHVVARKIWQPCRPLTLQQKRLCFHDFYSIFFAPTTKKNIGTETIRFRKMLALKSPCREKKKLSANRCCIFFVLRQHTYVHIERLVGQRVVLEPILQIEN
jgi:hypothetical protein